MRKLQKLLACDFLLVALLVTNWQKVSAFGFGEVGTWMNIEKLNSLKGAGRMLDTSNDKLHKLSAHQLIENAGFKYENYYALADDGYITQLIRIVNPLADANYLKQLPIILQHGQTANSKNFIMQSNKAHHPMRWPRKGGDFNWSFNKKKGPSSNRALAFMLSNNGYDVWLTSTRGVDKNNRGYLGTQPIKAIARGNLEHKNMTQGESKLLLDRIKRNYWSFSLDDQIAQELPSQIAVVLNVTGAEKVILFGYSNTALTTTAMLSFRHDITPFVDSFIAAAPVVYYNRLDGWFAWFMNGFMQFFPKNYDAELFLTDELAKFIRFVTIKACTPLSIRYTLCKFALDLMFGDSDQFTTDLELPFFSHMLRPTSWKCLAQHLQIVRSHRLEKFNYGKLLNKYYYGHYLPPEYDVGQIDPNVKIVLVSGDRDCWANQATLDELRGRLPVKPALDLVVKGYNHLDLAAGFDVDVKVNLPLLQWLDKRLGELSRNVSRVEGEEGGGDYTTTEAANTKRSDPAKPNWMDPLNLLQIQPPRLFPLSEHELVGDD